VSAKGVEYPETVPHFVLDDAKEVSDVYGHTPKEIEAFFMTDEIDEAVPAFWKWYSGGARDKDGNMVGGDLLCYGEGPSDVDPDGNIIAPGKAWHKSARDSKTGIIPVRDCFGEKCKDYCNSKGKVQCAPVMTINLFVPRASLMGIFTIETKSIITMSRFLSQLQLIKTQFGRLKGIPFKIYRDPVKVKSPEGASKTQYIVSIKPFLEFKELYGDGVTKQIESIISDNIVSIGGKSESLEYKGTEDVVPMTKDDYIPVPENNPVDAVKSIANDPEVLKLFDNVASLLKAENSEHKRIITVRKFEKSQDVKAATIKYLSDIIAKESAKKLSAPIDKGAPIETTSTPVQNTTIEVDQNGLI